MADKIIGGLFLSHKKDLLWNAADHLLYKESIMRIDHQNRFATQQYQREFNHIKPEESSLLLPGYFSSVVLTVALSIST